MQEEHKSTCYQDCQYANDYKIHLELGQGGQASVHLGSKGNQLYAIKVYAAGLNKDQAFKRQVQFLENLKFKYLINIVDSDFNAQVKLKKSKLQKRAIIVLQFAQAQMFDFISREGRFSPQVCRTVFKQLVQSIKFLDEKGISHRDLKPQNILFDKDFNLKVSDFGLSTFSQGHYKDGVLYSKVGTEGYKPPEMQQGKYTGMQADIFAAGVILFVMYNGTPPFISTKPIDKIYKLIKDKNFSKFWALHQKKRPLGFYPDSFKRLINQFFSFDPSLRPTFTSLSQDQWLNQDSVMSNELKQYMQKRYDKIAETDDIKKKIAEVRKQLFMNEIMQDQNTSNSSNQRSNSRGKAVDAFLQRRKQYKNIKIETLPQTQRRVGYFSKDLGFVLAFLNDYLDECVSNNKIFLQDFMQQIRASKFEMNIEGGDIELKFTFDIEGEQQQEQQQILKVKGKLFQKDMKQVGIEWEKVSGNDFWLSSIIKDISQRLQVLR